MDGTIRHQKAPLSCIRSCPLGVVARRIINEVRGINRVVYDIT